MDHHERAQETRRDAPTRLMRVLHLVLSVEETNFESLGEVLAEEMRRAALEHTPIAHQRLHRIGLLGAREPLRRALPARDEPDRTTVFAKRSIDCDDLRHLALGLI